MTCTVVCTFLCTKTEYVRYMYTNVFFKNVYVYIYIYNWRVKKIEERKKEIDAEAAGRVCERLLGRRTQWHVRYLSNINHKMVIFKFTNAELLIVCVWWFWILCLEKHNLTSSYISIILRCFQRRIRKLKMRRRRKK